MATQYKKSATRKSRWAPKPLDLPTSQYKPSTIKPTLEQLTIVNAAKQGKSLAIKAFAGSSKTTSCILVAEALPKVSLYMAFNKSIADEASTKFPGHVECRTVNSLAYRTIVDTAYKNKLQGFYQLSDLVRIIDREFIPSSVTIQVRNIVLEIIIGYCQSNYIELDTFIEDTFILQKAFIKEYNLVKLASLYWAELVDKNNPCKITHDVYLKLFQLSKPRLNYEVIYCDEFQDTNNVTLDIVTSQLQYGTQIILVGDTYQAIYAWRGAINALDNLPMELTTLYLTESFRFTQEIANIATKLTFIAGNDKQIVGRAMITDTTLVNTKAYIVRNNSTLLEYLLNAAKNNAKVYVIADLTTLWRKVYHISSLYFEQPIKYPDPELSQYSTHTELVEASEVILELRKLMSLSIILSSGGLTKNINDIKACIVDDVSKADYTLTTGHKSKGLEWDEVTLADDLFQVKEDETIEEFFKANQALNLLYVAVTRAKYKVNLPYELENYLENI